MFEIFESKEKILLIHRVCNFFQQDTNLFFIIVLFRNEYSMHVVLMIHSFFYVAPIQIQIWLGVQKVNCSCTILVPVYKLLQ